MSTTAEPPVRAGAERVEDPPLARAAGIELLGDVHGSGYEGGAALVRRADGQMVQLGPLMYAVLVAIDGRRDRNAVAGVASEELGRCLEPEHVDRLAEKLAALGLLAGTEDNAPPKANPLLALRWKVLVTDPKVTARITRPFTVLFRPWLMWPVLAAFTGVCWFVLIDKGVASATAQAFQKPGLLLLVFALAVASAGFHEIGHAAACRYGGATPRGMGMGLYVVWPAFYTDVTDAYRLPRRDRLRTDFGGLYFNAIVAVVTLGAWLAVRVDALLLLIAIQLIEMVKQLSPVFRADGYHILADATGVPDLYAHIGPTLRRLIPWAPRKESALTGRARLLVTAWVLIVVPVLLSMAVSAVILLPRLAATAWENGRALASDIPGAAGDGRILDVLADMLQLLALALPVAGAALMAQRIVRGLVRSGRDWSRDRPVRRALVLAAGATAVAGAAYAWWPGDQYEPVRADENGTLTGLVGYVTSPRATPPAEQSAARGVPQRPARIAPGRHLAVSMIPVGGATKRHPAVFVIKGDDGEPSVAILSPTAPDPSTAPVASDAKLASAPAADAAPPQATSTSTPAPAGGDSSTTIPATAFPFKLPEKPGPGDTQALAVNTKDGAVLYDIAYSVVTVKDGRDVTSENSAYALASCRSCTTVAVSFQVVLVIGQSNVYMPANVAEAINVSCPACITTALAEQIVVTLRDAPSETLLAQLQSELGRLNAISTLGGGDTTQQILTIVGAIKRDIDAELNASGLEASSSTPPPSSGPTSSTGSSPPASTTATPPPTTSTVAAPPAAATTPTTETTTPTTPTTTTQTTETTTTAPASTTPTDTSAAAPATTTPTTTP